MTGATEKLKHLKCHPEYYIPDGNLYILVEDTHFKVHSYFLTRESSTFRRSLDVPAEPGLARKGTSESNALVLENMTVEQFATFLWVFYDPKYLRITTYENWVTILDFAHQWEFTEIKALAISSLESLSIPLVDRIALYEKYKVSMEILTPHYVTLCTRRNMPNLEEVKTLGISTSTMIFSVREYHLKGDKNSSPFDGVDLKSIPKTIGAYFDAQRKKNNSVKNNQQNNDKNV